MECLGSKMQLIQLQLTLDYGTFWNVCIMLVYTGMSQLLYIKL